MFEVTDPLLGALFVGLAAGVDQSSSFELLNR
jgi:hypothetical protein